MRTINLELDQRSYPIYIGCGLLQQPELIRQHIRGRQVMIVSNDTVAPLYLDTLRISLGNLHHETVILPDGEQYKTLDVLNRVFDDLLKHRFDRHCTLLALGGGVVGDMAGFAAACYQRGVDFIQIPTTLLAQVDSSVGGKTAVNHPLGKNMIGAFYQPQAVIIDTETLNSLPPREFAAGMAEVIKYGLIRDIDFLIYLEQNLGSLLQRKPDILEHVIEHACRIKAEIVALDEREQGLRAILNLGHTFGHAIEAGLGYGRWLHGEAVAAGMVMAADLSARLGWLVPADTQRVMELLAQVNLPVKGPSELNVQQMLDLMAVDKKVHAGQLRLVLLQALGEAVVVAHQDQAQLETTLMHCGVAKA